MGNIVGIVTQETMTVEVYTNINNTLDYVGSVIAENLEREHIKRLVTNAAEWEAVEFEVVQLIYNN